MSNEVVIGKRSLKLFQELMKFLWKRIDPEVFQSSHQLSLQRRSVKLGDQDGENQDDNSSPPGKEAFITQEQLVLKLQLMVDQHHPYDRSLVSLQDLLSLMLLRLTTTTYDIQTQDRDDHKEEVGP